MIAENFREFIDKLHYNCCSVFKGDTVTDRDSTGSASCGKQVTEGQCFKKSVLLLCLK